MKSYDIVIIGAGISGATLAWLYAEKKDKKVLVVEKRPHIAGNCYDYINADGLLVSKYGAHLFHTNDAAVWEFVNQFADWRKHEHKVVAKVGDQTVPIPVNITTVNKLFNLQIQNESEMDDWLKKNQVKNDQPQNGEEAALARVGSVLYEKLFKEYTYKQWGKYPSELDASVLQRIPVRNNFDDRYFTDTHQGVPIGGYTKLFEKMLAHKNIEIQLTTDFFDIKAKIKNVEKIFYTGPIDRYFDFKHKLTGILEWRSINFEWQTLNQEYFQEAAVVNYPEKSDGDFTRIVEYKRIYEQQAEKTTICREYSTAVGEPYYPVPNPQNHAVYELYKEDAAKIKNVYFVGRLANYKYFNMDEAFRNALDLFKELQESSGNVF